MEILASASAARVARALAELGISADIVTFDGATRTSAAAAAAIGCSVAQIAKSIVFRARHSNNAVLVVASGSNRVDEKRVAAAIGEPVDKADAAFVREKTGFAIGGVAPVGQAGPVTVLIDEDLLALDPIWAAAGTPNSVFRLSPADLRRIPAARVLAVKAG
ncbi:MAG: YbaK/EbsC family protein [Pseudomonadota bacterium]|jgi:prolyl-tRNA editing enzyme YbaK/EbsC (Cys-tRNA(Pro) deacylase)